MRKNNLKKVGIFGQWITSFLPFLDSDFYGIFYVGIKRKKPLV